MPLSVILSLLSVQRAASPNSEGSVVDSDGTEGIVEARERSRPRECRSARVRRDDSVRLSSVCTSVSVSADDRGESLVKMTEDTDTVPVCDERFLQRGNGMERPRGDDGALAGADGGPSRFRIGSSNETWRTDSGLGTGSDLFRSSSTNRGATRCRCCCSRWVRRCTFSTI
jgi:hypothetical protein